jgi:hypothetical protein
VARFQISSTELGICSWGACITTTTEPTMHDTQPRTPSFSSRSLSTKCASTELRSFRSFVCQKHRGVKVTQQCAPPQKKTGLKNVPHYYAQCSKRSDKYGWRKDVRDEVCNLPEQHFVRVNSKKTQSERQICSGVHNGNEE